MVCGTWLDDDVEHLINPVVVDSCETPDLLDFRCGIWRVQDGMETIWKALKHGKKCNVFVPRCLPAVILDHFMTDCILNVESI